MRVFAHTPRVVGVKEEERLKPYSAGVKTHGLNPRAVKAMAEAGVDVSGHPSKHLDELRNVEFDHVITVCSRLQPPLI